MQHNITNQKQHRHPEEEGPKQPRRADANFRCTCFTAKHTTAQAADRCMARCGITCLSVASCACKARQCALPTADAILQRTWKHSREQAADSCMMGKYNTSWPRQLRSQAGQRTLPTPSAILRRTSKAPSSGANVLQLTACWCHQVWQRAHNLEVWPRQAPLVAPQVCLLHQLSTPCTQHVTQPAGTSGKHSKPT
jgi:hypothetical protein